MFEIEKGVPIPEITHASKYPFEKMEVGDSFFVEGDEAKNRLYSSASVYSKRHGGKTKFVVRGVDGGARCWRTS